MKTMSKMAAAAAVCAAILPGLGVAAEGADTSAPIIVRSAANGRLWQTCFSPSAPLEWYWGNAVSAQVHVVCHVERTTADSEIIVKAGGARYGSSALPIPATFGMDGKEYLYDATLSVFNEDGSVASEKTVRIACFPSVVGAPCKLLMKNSVWQTIEGVRVAGFDSSWRGETSTAEYASISGTRGDGTMIDIALGGTSGYEPLDANAICSDGITSLALDFSTLSSAWTASLHNRYGLSIIFR